MIRGTPAPETGMVIDLGALERALENVRALLDHKMLNCLAGLERPTLENLARFIFERLPRDIVVSRVIVHRDSCNEACSYVPEKSVP